MSDKWVEHSEAGMHIAEIESRNIVSFAATISNLEEFNEAIHLLNQYREKYANRQEKRNG